jgi:hypothetical protein
MKVVKSEILTVVTMKITVFWNVTPCSLVVPTIYQTTRLHI